MKRWHLKMHNQPISLDPWFELTGVFQRLFCDESYVYLEIANRLLSFHQESAESAIILHGVDRNMIGKKISILFTDLPNEPLIIRTISTHEPPKAVPAEIQAGKDNNGAAPNSHYPTYQIHTGEDRICEKLVDENMNGALRRSEEELNSEKRPQDEADPRKRVTMLEYTG